MTGTFKTAISLALALAFIGSAAVAEVKETDPGASCTNSTETIQGQTASCKSCSATKCDTSGSTVTNCRKETTKTCTIGNQTVNPGGPKTQVVPVKPSEVLDMAPATGGKKGIKGQAIDGGVKLKTAP
jgi:hypothetical protein